MEVVDTSVQTRDLYGLREGVVIELLIDVGGIVLWDKNDHGPTTFEHRVLEEGCILITGPTYGDEADLACCNLDYFHPPRMLWASDGSACFLVCPDMQVRPINTIQH